MRVHRVYSNAHVDMYVRTYRTVKFYCACAVSVSTVKVQTGILGKPVVHGKLKPLISTVASRLAVRTNSTKPRALAPSMVRYFQIISRNVLPHIQISAIKIVTGFYEG